MASTVYTLQPVVWIWVAARLDQTSRGLALTAALAGYGATASLALLVVRGIDDRRRKLLDRRGVRSDGYHLPERLVVWQTVALVVLLGAWFVLGAGAKAPLPR